jgi:hypothetical protein
MRRRKTRYDEGGIVPGDGRQDFDPEELAAAGERNLSKEIRQMQEARSSEGSEPVYNEVGDEVKGIRRNTETGETYYTDKPPVKEESVKAAPKVKSATGSGRSTGRGGPTAAEMAKYYANQKPSRSERAEIPGQISSGNEVGKTKSEQLESKVKDNVLKALAATGVTAGGAAAILKLKKMRDAAKQLQLFNKEVAKKFSAPQAREVGKNIPTRSEIKQAKEAGERKTAEALERDKPILQNRPGDSKAKRLRSVRRDEDDRFNTEGTFGGSFSRGGATKSSASKRADGCAVRGKTRGKMY